MCKSRRHWRVTSLDWVATERARARTRQLQQMYLRTRRMNAVDVNMDVVHSTCLLQKI